MNFSFFVPSLIIGVGLFGLAYFSKGLVAWFWGKVWLHSSGPQSKNRLIRRVKILLQLMRFPRLGYVMFIISAVIFSIVVAAELGQGKMVLPNAIALTIGFVGIPAVAPVLYSFRGIPERHLHIAIVAMKRLVAMAPRERLEEVLRTSHTFPENWIRIAMINGLMEVTEPWSLKEIERMEKDPDSDVRQAAREANALVYSLLYGSGARSLGRLDNLLEQHEVLVSRSRQNPGNGIVKDEVKRCIDAIDDIVYSQVPLKEAYPNLYCKQCMARSEKLKRGEWEWVRCKRCHDVTNLQKGIEYVRGEIGGDVEWKLDNGRLTVKAWDESRKLANPLELDELEIHSGAAMDYDWAVSAVVQKLQNHVHAGDRVPVKLDPGVTLSVNTQMMLRSLDPEIKL